MPKYAELENMRPDRTGELFDHGLNLESEVINQAYVLARQIHGDQKRNTGENYFENHCVPVASALQKLLPQSPWSDEVVAAALLHDTVEDHSEKVSIANIREIFGDRVALLVDGVTKMSTPEGGWLSRWEKDMSALRKMARYAYDDVGVALIKLADRSHNMMTFATSSEKTRKIKSGEAIRAYGKLAGILGCYEWKRWLEDVAFPYFDEEKYNTIKALADNDERLDKRFVIGVKNDIEGFLIEQGVDARVEIICSGYYEVWKKVEQKARRKQGSVNDLHSVSDLVSFRVILNGNNEVSNLYKCYSVLGMLNYKYGEYLLDDRIDDFIAVPQDSYMALQSTFDIPGVGEIEIAVETDEMNGRNQWGVIYDLNNQRSLDGYKVLTVITPTNGLRFVPEGATALDAVIAIQPNLTREMSGILVNGEMANLDDLVNPGDLIQVVVGGVVIQPDESWLEICHDIHAKRLVKQILRENMGKNLRVVGERWVNYKVRSWGLLSIEDLFILKQNEVSQILYEFGLSSVDELYLAIGAQSVSWDEFEKRILDKELITVTWLSMEIHGGGEANVRGVLTQISEFVARHGGNFLRIVHDTNEDGSFVLRVLIDGFEKQHAATLIDYCQNIVTGLTIEIAG